MTTIVNIYEAKTHFSKLIDDVVAGKEVIIAKNGKPVADLKPHAPKSTIKFGTLKGKVHYNDEHFDDEDPEIITMFEESKLFPDEK